MRTKIPEKEVHVCDFCRREGYLTKCIGCGKEYCITCLGIICGCVQMPDLCKECSGNKGVNSIVEKYAKQLYSIVRKRDKEIKARKRKTVKENKRNWSKE